MRFLYLHALLSLLAIALAQTTVSCPQKRVRRAWSQYSKADKDTYINAVALAMQKGYHQRFVEMHMDPPSEREAHGCLFFYWHRAFLLGYENMLRSLGNQYACVTIPYWDYATLGAKFIAGSCNNMLSCSTLLQDFGGSLPRGRSTQSRSVNGASFQTDNCVVSPMTQNFCQDTKSWTDKKCYNCMPRNDWSKVAVPPDVNIVNVFNNIMGNVKPTLAGVTAGVQAIVDAMHSIYYNCIVRRNPPANPGNDLRTWTTCRNSKGTSIDPKDIITMRVGAPATSIWTATSNPIYPFFQGLPRTYPAYADTSNLGSNSYTYDFTGTALDGMNNLCLSFKPPRAFLQESSLIEDRLNPKKASVYNPDTSSSNQSCIATESNWITEATALAAKVYSEPSDINNQVQMMLCVFYNECLGGVYDYSEEFKKTFRVHSPPPCKQVIDGLARGDFVIGVPGWEATMMKHYKCSSPSSVFA
uniref:Secreted protein n=1 Tax=Achlya hypogyna TaxID=1202772 RepID=A0A0A7CP77_ACHHY|nr:secreted protein [Achlya hypogyna]